MIGSKTKRLLTEEDINTIWNQIWYRKNSQYSTFGPSAASSHWAKAQSNEPILTTKVVVSVDYPGKDKANISACHIHFY